MQNKLNNKGVSQSQSSKPLQKDLGDEMMEAIHKAFQERKERKEREERTPLIFTQLSITGGVVLKQYRIPNLRIYKDFVEVITQFKKHYNLSRSIREVDWFLWIYGKEFLSLENKKELKTPTDKLVDEYAHQSKTTPKYAVGDKALNKLKKSCFSNSNLEGVWLKIIVINNLYSTNIYDTFKMANHIVQIPAFDKRLASGGLNLVEEIRRGHGISRKKNGKEIDFYSFATKYCSEHNPDVYPLFDKYVKGMLFEYKQKDNFTDFTG